jgi:hypothetical protein
VFLFKSERPSSMLFCSIVTIVIITMIEKIPTTTPKIVSEVLSLLFRID